MSVLSKAVPLIPFKDEYAAQGARPMPCASKAVQLLHVMCNMCHSTKRREDSQVGPH